MLDNHQKWCRQLKKLEDSLILVLLVLVLVVKLQSYQYFYSKTLVWSGSWRQLKRKKTIRSGCFASETSALRQSTEYEDLKEVEKKVEVEVIVSIELEEVESQTDCLVIEIGKVEMEVVVVLVVED